MDLSFFVVFCVAALVSCGLGRVVMVAGLWDDPSARKAHKGPVPTSGGLAIGGGAAVALAIAALPDLRGWSAAVDADAVARTGAVALVCFAALALGLVDDLRPLKAAPKFGLLAALALAVALFWARADALPVGVGLVIELGLVFGVVGSALWVFTLVNATNFMDGANGLAMGSIGVGLLGIAAVGLASGAPHAAIIALAAAGSMAGFLVWNFPNGRLFAGDAGSLFAGMAAASASLLVVQDGGVSPFVPAIMFFPLLADVLLTLAHRVAKKRNLFNGHREHFYQIGVRAGLSHGRMAVLYWALTAHCVLVGFLVAFGSRAATGYAPQLDAGALGLMQDAAAMLAAASGPIALAALAFAALKVSGAIRKFAAARGLDTEV